MWSVRWFSPTYSRERSAVSERDQSLEAPLAMLPRSLYLGCSISDFGLCCLWWWSIWRTGHRALCRMGSVGADAMLHTAQRSSKAMLPKSFYFWRSRSDLWRVALRLAFIYGGPCCRISKGTFQSLCHVAQCFRRMVTQLSYMGMF